MKKIIHVLIIFIILVGCFSCNKNNISDIPPSSVDDVKIELQQTDFEIIAGEKVAIPSSNIPVSFLSNDEEIAYCKNGEFYGVKEGITTMKVKSVNNLTKDIFINIDVKQGTVKETTDFNRFANSLGRNEIENDRVIMHQSASSISFAFVGTKIELSLFNKTEGGFGTSYLSFLIDDEKNISSHVENFEGSKVITIDGLKNGYHTIKILKRNECKFSTTILSKVSTDGYFTYQKNEDKLKIEVYGDSITCGYSVYGEPYNNANTNALESYAYYVANELNADLSVFASSGIGLAKSSETTINMIDCYDKYYQGSDKSWNFSFIPDIVIINLGTNDLWGGANASEFAYQYNRFLIKLRAKYPTSKFVCVGGMMTDGFNDTIDSTIKRFNNNSYFCALPKANGTRHPIVSEQTQAGKVLLDFIKSII